MFWVNFQLYVMSPCIYNFIALNDLNNSSYAVLLLRCFAVIGLVKLQHKPVKILDALALKMYG